jgi:hypothetical protein
VSIEAVRSMLHVSNTDALKSVYFAYFHSVMKYGIIFGVIHQTAKRYSHYKGKLLDTWLVSNPEIHAEIYFKRL